MQNFDQIYARAQERHGGEEAVKSLLPEGLKSPEQLEHIPDAQWLSAMTKAIFKAGFSWQVIENKWPGFEEAFWNFDIERCAAMPPDVFDELCKDTRIVRNPQKIETVVKNAQMIQAFAREHGSFAKFIAHWPAENYAELLELLKKNGSRLGGMTSQFFLREIGKDGYVLSKDGTAALIEAGIIEKAPTSKSALQAIQGAYNIWHAQSGFSYAQISKILALSTTAA